MADTKDIVAAITFLRQNGYAVEKAEMDIQNIGKWVAFRQDGMNQILHGKVIAISDVDVCTIKCKNGACRWACKENIIGFYDNKQECYAVKEMEHEMEI